MIRKAGLNAGLGTPVQWVLIPRIESTRSIHGEQLRRLDRGATSTTARATRSARSKTCTTTTRRVSRSGWPSRPGCSARSAASPPSPGPRFRATTCACSTPKEQVKDAPKADGDLDAADEEALFAHYNVNTLDPEYGGGERADTGYSHQARREDDAMTRSEEELSRFSTESARDRSRPGCASTSSLSRRQVTVPVQREEVCVLSEEPITEAQPGVAAMSGAPDTDESGIQPCAHTGASRWSPKETVPSEERVRLGEGDRHRARRTVSGQVRKEQVEVQDDTKDSKPARK